MRKATKATKATKAKKEFSFVAVFAVVAVVAVFAGEKEETLQSAYQAYLEGRLEDSAGSYKYLLTLSPEDPSAAASAALVLKEQGKLQETLPLWLKASHLAPQDGFPLDQLGWSYLALGDTEKASGHFEKAFALNPEDWEAKMGLGLSQFFDGNRKAAQESLRRSNMLHPFSGATHHVLGLISLGLKKQAQAIAYFQNALRQNPLAVESLEQMASAYLKLGNTDSAWQVLRSLLDMDPSSEKIQKQLRNAEKYLQKRPEDLIAVHRQSWPLLQKPQGVPSLENIHVGLYADSQGAFKTASQFSFVCNSGFTIIDEKLGPSGEGPENQPWQVLYRSDNQTIEFRNLKGETVHSTRFGARIVPKAEGGTLLVKNIKLPDPSGIDTGDRDLRGGLSLIPESGGFRLVNELPLEAYLLEAVSSAEIPGRYAEAVKAQAVVSRSLALYLKRFSRHAPTEGVNVCDSRHCLLYRGVQQENPEAAEAVRKTKDEILLGASTVLEALSHPACGGMTEDGVYDSSSPARPPRSPEELERLYRRPPSRDVYCQISSLTSMAALRWCRLLEAEEIERRANRISPIGRLMGVQVQKRSPAGRILEIRLNGERSSLALTGFEALQKIFSPESLRSSAFVFYPLYERGGLKHLLVWGFGTGDGRGLCRSGAAGMASLGQDYKSILKHYFPKASLSVLKPQ